jgi:hypothetical protein
MNTDQIIDKITKIRAKNNLLWMGILALALRYSPEKAKPMIRKITENDRLVSRLTKRLGK